MSPDRQSDARDASPIARASTAARGFAKALGLTMKFTAMLTSLASVAISLGFCWLGNVYFASSYGSAIAMIAALFSCAYGLGSLVLLWMAWLRPSQAVRRASQGAAAVIAGFWFAGSLDSGRISGLELYSMIGIGIVVLINIVAVSHAIRAQKGA